MTKPLSSKRAGTLSPRGGSGSARWTSSGSPPFLSDPQKWVRDCTPCSKPCSGIIPCSQPLQTQLVRGGQREHLGRLREPDHQRAGECHQWIDGGPFKTVRHDRNFVEGPGVDMYFQALPTISHSVFAGEIGDLMAISLSNILGSYCYSYRYLWQQ